MIVVTDAEKRMQHSPDGPIGFRNMDRARPQDERMSVGSRTSGRSVLCRRHAIVNDWNAPRRGAI
ncbi:hypothetical protein CBOM_05425 [Ceraceosorus bombacis]|uniref:Uncharacterized protein n=1 Tax=Ceraceosorus bombacis TaxID=401625 RepID=A0A0N7LB88_9BASI|nr:hypothetical protein CBOM_05425 [Ceraceosorus bombacis]